MGEIIVTLENDEKKYDFEALSLSFDSTSDEILNAVQPVVLEEFGVNLKGEGSEYIYTVKKIESSGNVYLFPKSPAGK